jgi:hypothetical protein
MQFLAKFAASGSSLNGTLASGAGVTEGEAFGEDDAEAEGDVAGGTAEFLEPKNAITNVSAINPRAIFVKSPVLLGGFAPHFGHAFAVVLTSFPHSLHFVRAICNLRRREPQTFFYLPRTTWLKSSL